MNWKIHTGDCLEVLRTMPDNSVDAVVTDPPYGLAFMGKRWDYDVPGVEAWSECLRVLKPGGHLLAFFGTRTYHRGVVRVEDAGFEIRDCIAWVYGQGFPKSKNVALSIDKGDGYPNRGRAIPTASTFQACDTNQKNKLTSNIVPPYEAKTAAARQWQGWGTALKPAMEPIVVARKPLSGTVAENVLRWGTGAVNVDGCRVGSDQIKTRIATRENGGGQAFGQGGVGKSVAGGTHVGRWPANLIHDGSDEVVGMFPDDGKQSAARFFYCAKASKGEREAGLREAVVGTLQGGGADANDPVSQRFTKEARNVHPTVKPVALMAYLCRLVTPPGGVVLDPFTGSGSTGVACVREGFNFIGIEREPEYVRIAEARIQNVTKENG